MKRLLLVTMTVITVIIIYCIYSCNSGDGKKENPPEIPNQNLPLNITIYIDLSDRIIHSGQPSQVEKDTAMISYIVNYFVEKTRQFEKGLQESKNAIKVLFFPPPTVASMVKCADELNLDVPKVQEGVERRDKVLNAKATFQKNLEHIYQQAIAENSFIGCDIWGFFSYGKAKQQCVKEGYRNILFILTDGYVYHKDNISQQGDTSTFILPKVLDNPNAALEVVKQNELENLEVAIMEIQPNNPKHLPKMKSMLKNWLVDMGMKPDNITIEETDLPANTRIVIDKLLN